MDAAIDVCERDSDCDDGRFCNGRERCAPGGSGSDARTGCAPGTPPCESATCDEAEDRCGGSCVDEDGDGQTTCDGDCNDRERTVFRGAPEICDALGVDEDCNPLTFGDRDADGDGVVDDDCFNRDGSTRYGGADCNDDNAMIHPTAREICEGRVDENCNGMFDEGCPCTEGATRNCPNQIGACAGSTQTCTAQGWGVCSREPMPEVCDGPQVDENCDGRLNEGCECVTGAMRQCGMGACRGMQTCMGGAWTTCNGRAPTTEVCDGIDNDCDGIDDASDPSVVGTGSGQCGTNVGTCEYGNRTSCVGSALVCGGGSYVGPAGNDLPCDHQDNDCDNQIDENGFAAWCEATLPAFTNHLFGRRYEYFCYPGGERCTSTVLSTGAGNEVPRGMFSQWRGDVGRDTTLSAAVRVRDTTANGTAPEGTGSITFLLTPQANVPSEGGGTFGFASFSTLQPDEAGLAVMLSGNAFGASFWRHRPGSGWDTVNSQSFPPGCRELPSSAPTLFYFLISNSGGTFTFNIRFSDRCSISYAFTDAEFWRQMYGERQAYPRYQLGVIADNDGDLEANIQEFAIIRRTAPGDRNNCVGCT